jgi:hypothetical protein
MEKIKEFIENNKLNCDILNYYYGHEATKGCKSGHDNINPYALVFDKEKEEKYYILVLSNTNCTIISYDTIKAIKKYNTSWYFSNNGYVTGTINGKNIYLHQYLLNYHGNGKGQNSIDHINRNKLDNRLENLRIVDQSIQNINREKTARKSNAQELPHMISSVELPKFCYYCKEVLHKDTDKETIRDFFRIENHPNLEKKCISTTKSMKIPILEKLNEAKKILSELDNKKFQKIKKNPDYIQLNECKRNTNNFIFVFDRRFNGERQTLKLSFNKSNDKNVEYNDFRKKIKEKYDYETDDFIFD